jgi:mono/diheme cytochrome c family protein
MVTALLALDARATAGLAVVGGLALFVLLLLITASGELRGRRVAKVPSAFRPAPSDEELESKVFERAVLWAALCSIFIALWLPLYWLREPTRLDQKAAKFNRIALEQGEEIYSEFCATCHGEEAEGLSRTVTINGKELQYAEPPLAYLYDRYRKAGRNEEEINQIVYDAINRGRPGTPMPTWALAFGGPLNTYQVDTLVDWLRSIQVPVDEKVFRGMNSTDGEEIFKANCAICHSPPGWEGNDELVGTGGVGPNLRSVLTQLNLFEVRTAIEQGRLNINRPSMPTWAAFPSTAIDALLKFIVSIQEY